MLQITWALACKVKGEHSDKLLFCFMLEWFLVFFSGF